MKSSEFKIGDRFRLKSRGWEKSHFEVVGHGDTEQFGPYLRVKDLENPGYSPMWIFDFQLALYAETNAIRLDADLKRNIELVEAGLEFLPIGAPIPYDLGINGLVLE